MLCISFACKSPKRVMVNRMEKTGIPIDKEWTKKLERSKKEVLESWLDVIHHDLTTLERSGISLSKPDLDMLKFYPIVKYEIDSISYINISSTTDVSKILKISNERAKYYILKDNQFIATTYSNCLYGKMEVEGYCSLSKAFSKTIKDILFTRYLPFFEVEIVYGPSSNLRSGYNVFIDEHGKLMSFKVNEDAKPFNEVLLDNSLRWRANNAKK